MRSTGPQSCRGCSIDGEKAPTVERVRGLLQSETPQLNVMHQKEHFDFEVILDSGAAEHVVDNADTPGYELKESPGSRAGACFVAANGERIPNKGQVQLNLKLGDTPASSTFQVSRISRPLWSVGKVCDAGDEVTFKRDGASVLHVATGKKVGDFTRKQGLYAGDFKLRNPAAVFSRQGR